MDISKLTLGEVAKVEELSGQSLRGMGDEAQPMGKMLAALAFVTTRRTNPKYTWNDALGLTIDEANAAVGITDDDDEFPDDDDDLLPDGEDSEGPTQAPEPPKRRAKSA